MHFKSCCCLVILLFYLPEFSSGQSTAKEIKDNTCGDSLRLRFKELAVPAGLISGGIIVELANVKKEVQNWFPRTNTQADDYLRYVPVFILYGSDLFGSEHRNNAFNQTKLLLISELLTGALTQAIKRITNVTRPNGGDLSFPSGHTSEAFAAAALLYNETIDYNPVLAYSGYLFSTATGVLRITNNRHWVSDVLVGAGLGILVTNLVYHFDPLKNWDPLKLNGKAEIIPQINASLNTYCLGIRIRLK